MKDREIACEYYICEGTCTKGRKGTFKQACQTCNKYKPIKGGRPARTDNRRKIIEKILSKEKEKRKD